MTGGCSATRSCALVAIAELAADLVQDTFEAAARAWTRLRRRAGGQQRAWLLGTLANKDISDLRRREAFRRKQPDILARYLGTASIPRPGHLAR